MAVASRTLISLVVGSMLSLIFASNVLATDLQTLRPFDRQSYRNIVAAREGRPFLLVFWSTDCPPCHGELKVLGKLKQDGLPLDLVLVSTDGIAASATITQLLREKGLSGVEAWVFAESVAERLRFAVDPRWYGELPRSYMFDAAHTRTAHTGPLTESDIRSWLDSLTARADR